MTSLLWEENYSFPSLTLDPVAPMDLIRYAGASGDYNPIHLLEDAATEAGLNGIIQHGMLTMAYMGKLFSPHLDRGFIADCIARFKQPARIGDCLTITGTITSIERSPQYRTYYCTVRVVDQSDREIATGTVSFRETLSE